MDNSSPTSPILCVEDNEPARIVALNEPQEETMANIEAQNTQYVLEVEPAAKKKKTTKGKTLQSAQKKAITTSALMLWLSNFWQTDKTLRVMKPFLKMINDAALQTKNMKLFNVGQTVQKIMKDFFTFMKTNERQLTECSYATFEEWCLNDGLSTTYGRIQKMDWADDLDSALFDHYSSALVEYEKKQKAMEEVEEEEEHIAYQGSLSLPSMKSTSMSSMTALTAEAPVVASTSKDCASTQLQQIAQRKLRSGQQAKQVTFQREKSACSKQKTLDTDDEDYSAGSLFKKLKTNKLKTVEEESEPEIEIRAPKRKRKQSLSESDSEDDHTPKEEDFYSMVANHARARSLVTDTGKISQSILIKDGEAYINISSPGERGSSVVKLELYPFNDCVRLQKNQYWTKRTFSCLGVICGEDSRAHRLAMKLRTELTKQILKLEGTKVEKKAQTGWRGS